MFRYFNVHIQYPPKKDKYVSYFKSFYNLSSIEVKILLHKTLNSGEFILINIVSVDFLKSIESDYFKKEKEKRNKE